MTAAEMDIIVGAKVDGAVTGLKQVNTQLATTSKASEAAGESFQLSTRHALGFSRGLQELGAEASAGQLDIRGFFEVLRVGATEFQHIKSETGSATTAFGSLAGALFSEETVILLVVTALATFISHLLKAKEATDTHKKSIDEYARAMEAATKATAQQYDAVSKIVEQSKLHETTLGQQKTLLKELQDTNSTYFGSLKIENGLITGLNEAYNNYANNILAVAKAKAASETIGALTEELIKTKQQTQGLDENFTNLNLSFKTAGALLKDIKGATPFEQMANASKKVDEILAKAYPTLEDMAFLTAATGLSEQKIRNILGDRLQLKTKEAQLQAQISTDSALIAKNEISGVKATEDKTKAVKDMTDAIRIFKGDNLDIVRRQIEDNMGAIKPNLNKGPGLTVAQKDYGNIIEQFNEINAITKTVSDTFNSLFETIASGGNAFKSLVQSIEQVIIKLIEAVAQAVIFTLIMNLITGGTASVGGAALGALKGFFGVGGGSLSMQSFATGGVVTRPTLALVGESGPERITPLGYEGAASNAMQVEGIFHISGQNLRAVLTRANQTAYNTF